jgi:glycosyltransferase involved in cell wall biosynthesis
MKEKRKTIALVMTSMNTGGIATSINNLMEALPKDKYEIDLILFNSDSINRIPERGVIISAGKYMRQIAINQKKSLEESFWLASFRYILGGICKIFGHGLAYSILLNNTEALEKEYDFAISCSQSGPQKSLYGGCNEYVLKKINAKQKITFIHCDYKRYGLHSKYSHKIYGKFDKIAAVSQSVKKCFLKCEPEYRNKTYVVSNFQNYDAIRKMSEMESLEYDHSKVNFITVARLGKEKGHMRMLPILLHIKKQGFDFVWHIVGGDENDAPPEFLEKLKEYKLESNIILHGKQSNPYRFLKNTDFLLIPSYHEAAPMVYAEAMCLGVPILTTDTLSAKELVEAQEIGLVCENTDDAIEESIISILRNPKQLEKYKNKQYLANNDKAYCEFEKMLEIEEK